MATPSPEPDARLGAAHLDAPIADANTTTSFRAVPERAALAPELGPLNDLPGRWNGAGFNLIARPHFGEGSDRFIELNLTRETLEFTTIGSPIPNRGSDQADISLRGVTYLQQISDAKTNGALHIEPGIWLHIPATTAPAEPESVSRLANIPHGDAVCAVGGIAHGPGKPKIDPVNTVPFAEGQKAPAPGSPNGFPEYDLSIPTKFRTDASLLGEITQAMVDDPTVALRHALHNQTITETTTLSVTTHKNKGGRRPEHSVRHGERERFVHERHLLDRAGSGTERRLRPASVCADRAARLQGSSLASRVGGDASEDVLIAKPTV